MSDKTALELAIFLIMNGNNIQWNRDNLVIQNKGKLYKVNEITNKLIEMWEVMEDETEQ